MNRHIVIILGRVLGVFPVIIALPLTHLFWRTIYPGDGHLETGFLASFLLIGSGAGAVYCLTGCIIHYKFRKRRTKTLMLAEMMLLALFVVLLIYVGLSVEYAQNPPPKP
jgi:hypothetical protein